MDRPPTSYYNGLWGKSFSTKEYLVGTNILVEFHYLHSIRVFRIVVRGGVGRVCCLGIFLGGGRGGGGGTNFQLLAEMSAILEFIMCMTGINSSLSSQFSLPVVKAFMDNLFLMLPSRHTTQELLYFASVTLSWARISVQASKYKSLVIVSRKIVHDESLCITSGVNHQVIPSIADNPVKFLERTISDNLSDKYQADCLALLLTKGLGLINNSGHCVVQSWGSYNIFKFFVFLVFLFYGDKIRAKDFQLH